MVSKFRLDSAKQIETKEAIARTIEIANNYAGELTIEVLPLDKLELDPENNRELVLTLNDALDGIEPDDSDYERKKQDWKSLESLAKTINDDQLINPIYVYRYGNKCRLITGERRTLASAIAGKKEIIARIANKRPVGAKLKILQWIENNERVDLSLAERVSSIESIINEHLRENKENGGKERITAQLLSDLTGMSMTQSRRYILISHAKPTIKQAIADGKLENIKLIELLCSVVNEEHQNELLNAALSGKIFDEINKLKYELEIGQKKKRETRGRKRTNVRLGAVKPNIIKIIIDALLSAKNIKDHTMQELIALNQTVQWNNSESIEKSFKKVIALLDTGV